ncbi:MAG: peptidylprolyl isomerase [Bacillota bacterium]|nr:peptidylprolyl isomerase [Bacillota bacterium]
MKKIQYAVVIAVAVLLVAAAAAAVYFSGRSEVVALVNGEKITKDEFYNALVENNGQAVLEQLISKAVIYQEAKKQNIDITTQDVAARKEKIIEENFNGNEEHFRLYLEQYGVKEERFDDSIKIDLILERIITGKTEITAEEIRDYYAKHSADFNIPHRVNVRHILLETEEEAWEIIEKLEQGEEFAELAGQYSKDPGTAAAGGELGFVEKGDLVKEFEDVAFSEPVGLYRQPVKTAYGYHVIEVLEIQEAREVTFSEAEEQVKEALLREIINSQVNEVYRNLRNSAKVEIMLE